MFNVKEFDRQKLRNAFKVSSYRYLFNKNPALRRLGMRAGLIAQPQ